MHVLLVYRDYHLLPSPVLLLFILMCRSITTQLDEIIAKYFYLFCATELIPKRRLPTMHFVRYSANFGTKGRGQWNVSLIRSETGDPAIESPEELLLPNRNQTMALGVHLNRFSAVLAIGGRKLAKKKKKKLILSKEPNNINKIAFGYFKAFYIKKYPLIARGGWPSHIIPQQLLPAAVFLHQK